MTTTKIIRKRLRATIKNKRHLVEAIAATARYRYPSRKITVIGITGTDGKTTTASLIHHLLKHTGYKVSLISTVGAKIVDDEFSLSYHTTTPGPQEIQKYLRQAVAKGSTHIVLETTSHGLDQHRVWGIKFKIGVMTNITNEHLDYHETFENYLQAKLKLFRKAEISVLNADDPSVGSFIRASKGSVISYGIKNSADIKAKNITLSLKNTAFSIFISRMLDEKRLGSLPVILHGSTEGQSISDAVTQEFAVKTSLLGEFNVYNCLAAISCAVALKIDPLAAIRAIESFGSVFGRMNSIEMGQPFSVIIDFAHTSGSFEKVLPFIREHATGRLIHMFGCAGLRDTIKRPAMGRLSAKYADIIILTAEDPRTESIDDINRSVIFGIEQEGFTRADRADPESIKPKSYIIIPDRREAIQYIMNTVAQKDDTVFLSGKGHEQSMCYGKIETPWSEHEVVREAITKRISNN